MKKVHFIILLFLILGVNLTCTKDEISEPEKSQITNNLPVSVEDIGNNQTNDGLRDGVGDLIFYRTSLTSDNYLLLNNTQTRFRIHKIYNKTKVKEIKFANTGKPDVRVGSTLMGHYKIEISYLDNSVESFTAYSKKSLSTFVFKPTGDNLLSTTNPAKFISYETTGTSSINPNSIYYNPWRDESYSLYRWTIRKENSIVATKEIEPLNKNSRQFMVIHVD